YDCSGEPPAGVITCARSPAADPSGPETLPALPAQRLLPPQPIPQLQHYGPGAEGRDKPYIWCSSVPEEKTGHLMQYLPPALQLHG
ncbi:hypothetical protein DPX16_11094, partial [Anabarilius grahami]